jgi:hypothetical protein
MYANYIIIPYKTAIQKLSHNWKLILKKAYKAMKTSYYLKGQNYKQTELSVVLCYARTRPKPFIKYNKNSTFFCYLTYSL